MYLLIDDYSDWLCTNTLISCSVVQVSVISWIVRPNPKHTFHQMTRNLTKPHEPMWLANGSKILLSISSHGTEVAFDLTLRLSLSAGAISNKRVRRGTRCPARFRLAM